MTADMDTLTLDFGVDEPAPVGTSRETTLDTPVKPRHAKPWQVWERFVSHQHTITKASYR